MDYDLWIAMQTLISRINMKVHWIKVASHVENRRYKDGQEQKGDNYSIRLNTVVNAWTRQVREDGAIDGEKARNP